MNYEPEFKGYWSEREKEIWQATDWKARNYEELPVEDDIINSIGYFYGLKNPVEKPLIFVKYIRSNPIYPPYYGPIYDSKLKEYMYENSFVGPMYDGNNEGNYQIHDRFETSELYNQLSN